MKTPSHISALFPLPRFAVLFALPTACLLTGCSDPADKLDVKATPGEARPEDQLPN